MPRQQFESVIAQATRKQLKIVNASQTISVAPSGVLNIDLYGSPNKLCKIVNLFIWQQGTFGTTGSYDIFVELDDVGVGISPNFLSKNTGFGNTARFDRNVWFAPTTGATPANSIDVISAIQQIRFDSTRALRIQLINNLNQTMTGDFLVYVAFEEEEVRL